LFYPGANMQALFTVLVVFSLQLRGCNDPEMRALLAPLLGLDPANYLIGRMTYDLRRLRLRDGRRARANTGASTIENRDRNTAPGGRACETPWENYITNSRQSS
jgi:hypothetical protein